MNFKKQAFFFFSKTIPDRNENENAMQTWPTPDTSN